MTAIDKLRDMGLLPEGTDVDVLVGCYPFDESYRAISLAALEVVAAVAVEQAELKDGWIRVSKQHDELNAFAAAALERDRDREKARADRLKANWQKEADARREDIARADGLYEEVVMYGRANGELKDALADEKARADRLQVCGTCDHNGGTRCREPQARDDGFYWETGNDGRLQECAFTPSRWTMHEVLARRTGGETP